MTPAHGRAWADEICDQDRPSQPRDVFDFCHDRLHSQLLWAGSDGPLGRSGRTIDSGPAETIPVGRWSNTHRCDAPKIRACSGTGDKRISRVKDVRPRQTEKCRRPMQPQAPWGRSARGDKTSSAIVSGTRARRAKTIRAIVTGQYLALTLVPRSSRQLRPAAPGSKLSPNIWNCSPLKLRTEGGRCHRVERPGRPWP